MYHVPGWEEETNGEQRNRVTDYQSSHRDVSSVHGHTV